MTARPRTAPPARRAERTVADLVAEAWPDGKAPVRYDSGRTESDSPGPPEPRKASALESIPKTDSPVRPESGPEQGPGRRGERTVADLVAERWGAPAPTGYIPPVEKSADARPTSFFDDLFDDADFDDEVDDDLGPATVFGDEYLANSTDDADEGKTDLRESGDPRGSVDHGAGRVDADGGDETRRIPPLDAALRTRNNVLRSIGSARLVDAAVTKVNTGLRRPDGTKRVLAPWLAGPGAAATVLVATLVAGVVSHSQSADESVLAGSNAASSSDTRGDAAPAAAPPGAAQDGAPAANPAQPNLGQPNPDTPNLDKYASGRKTGDATPGALSRRGIDIGVRNGPIDCARPGRILNLDSWKLTLPIGAASKPTEIRGGQLASYSTDYFKVGRTCNAVAFKAPVNGVTTSGSKNPRSELREMTGGGTSNAGWSSTSGTHTMVLTEAFTKLPDGKPQLVGGQIHDADDDVSVFRLEGSNLYVTNGDDTHYQLVTSKYVLGTPFEAKYVVSGGVIRAFYNGQLVATINKAFSGAYFKAGAYTQANCGNASPCSSSNYGEVLVYALKVTHTP
ncbi:MAG TPA: polysaccharide lyase family 7 protein [Pseudonocardia sp.]|nr:polysaccharide lyase family 7 protein [Pseudonocardia sp.]